MSSAAYRVEEIDDLEVAALAPTPNIGSSALARFRAEKEQGLQLAPEPEPETPEPAEEPAPPAARREGWGATALDKFNAEKERDKARLAHATVALEEEAAKVAKPCCTRCCAAVLWVRTRRVRGFELPVLFTLGGSLLLPLTDAASDWAVTLSWYLSDDTGWFAFGLTIMLVGGLLSGALLGWMLSAGRCMCLCFDIAGGPDARRAKTAAHDLGGKHGTTRGGNCHPAAGCSLGLLLGGAGLGPMVMSVLALVTQGTAAEKMAAVEFVQVFKVIELVFEALPQSILQICKRTRSLCVFLRSSCSCRAQTSVLPTASSSRTPATSAGCWPCPSACPSSGRGCPS